MFNTELARLRPLFDGADRGAYTLPDDVEKIRGALVRVDAMKLDPIESPLAVAERLASDAVEAILAGKKLPAADVIVDAERAQRVAQLQAETVHTARALLVDRLVATVEDMAEVVVTDHLRPALDALLAQATAAAATAGPHLGLHDAQLLALDDNGARAAVVTLDTCASRYAAIRSAHRVILDRLGGSLHDHEGRFVEFRDAVDLFPQWAPGSSFSVTPWPEQARARMAWIATSGVTAWLPLPDEIDSEWLARYGDQIANRRNLRQYADMHGTPRDAA